MDDFVRIQHPAIEGVSSVTTEAYEHLQERGWVLAEEQTPPPGAASVRRPQKNDSTAEWRTYAVTQGMPESAAEQMSRDDLVHHFAAPDTEEN